MRKLLLMAAILGLVFGLGAISACGNGGSARGNFSFYGAGQ